MQRSKEPLQFRVSACMKGNVALKPSSIASVQVKHKKIFSIARSPAQAWRAKAYENQKAYRQAVREARSHGKCLRGLFFGKASGQQQEKIVHAKSTPFYWV